jgi:hypothetical protein
LSSQFAGCSPVTLLKAGALLLALPHPQRNSAAAVIAKPLLMLM